MELITKDDIEKKNRDLFEKLSRGEQIWADKKELLSQATTEIIIEKINEIVNFANHIKWR